MVDIKGAVLLATEMEEVVADLQLGVIKQPDTAMELLMQAFLQLPGYLSSMRSSRQDNPKVLLPLINSLRATRGADPLRQTDIFSPNLSVRVPTSIFDVRAEPVRLDVQSMARAARLRFQSGLLEWYRNAESNTGLQTLVDVLEHLQQCAASEPAARIWWVGTAVAEALRDGLLETSAETKQLFGQLDRQIKRLIDAGEAVFDDVLSDDLMKKLLFRVAQVADGSEQTRLISETYGIKQLSVDCGVTDSENDELMACSDEMLQTVAVTVRSDIDRIKEQIDNYKTIGNHDAQYLIPVVDELHALANTLGMIGMDLHAEAVAGSVQTLRETVLSNNMPDEAWLVLLANTLVAAEDALGNVAADNTESTAFIQGFNAVTREVVVSIGLAKDAISEHIKSSDNFDSLSVVPDLLNQVSGSLRLAGENRAAVAADQVRLFITHELIDRHQSLYEDQLDSLADALCSIEFHVEEVAENRSHTGTALDVAEQSLLKLGYPCPKVDELICASSEANTHEQSVYKINLEEQSEGASVNETIQSVQQLADVDERVEISGMQIIAPDADEEILDIFIEEADEELQKLAAFIPMWAASAEAKEYLVDIRRSFHTLKGSGRMVGALAVGEFAWVLENLANKVIDDTITPHDAIKSILADSVAALAQLLTQVKGGAIEHEIDIDSLAGRALLCSDPSATVDESLSAEGPVSVVEFTSGDTQNERIVDASNTIADYALNEAQPSIELPVLSREADAEIVDIFLEEAVEEIAIIAVAIPVWLEQPDNEDALASLRRSLHTLKGSGRMAGAMVIGEFSWCVENLLTKLIEGTVEVNDSIRSLLVNLPDALSQLVDQVQGGAVPVIDTASMMLHADALGRGETIVSETAGDIGDNTEATAESADAVDVQCAEAVSMDIADSEPSLLVIFNTECSDHLRVIEEFIDEGDKPRVVSEGLYRALHTLSGISESAEVVSIRDLAGSLNDYFEEYYHAQQLISHDAISVLRASYTELTTAVQRLPELALDESAQKILRDQIAALPRVVVQATEDDAVSCIPDATSSEIDVTKVNIAVETVSEASDPFSGMDQELYEIFVEEASEIIDSSEAVLRAWSGQPENIEYMTEFQRQLHTIKGGARMVDIQAIGDLSHVLESLMARIADGVISTSGEMFALMQESQDRLSEMLEQVKARQMPAAATQLEARLDALWQTGCSSVASDEQCSVSGSHDETVSEADTETEAAALQEAVEVEEPVSDHDMVVEPENIESDTTACEAEPVHGLNADIELPEREHISFPQKRERQKQTHAHGEQVRVQSTLLDDMVNYAGEINIYRSRMEQQVSDYRYNLAELDQTITRLRDQLRQLEMETEAQILYRYEQEVSVSNQDFDPLEMDRYSNLQQSSRSLIESISDLRSLQELMENYDT